MTEQYNWSIIQRLASGHRIFRDEVTQRIAIADKSGSRPDSCDDGVMWLKLKESATIVRIGAHLAVQLPVEAGNGRWAGVELADVPYLANTLGFRIKLGADVAVESALWSEVLAIVKAQTEAEEKLPSTPEAAYALGFTEGREARARGEELSMGMTWPDPVLNEAYDSGVNAGGLWPFKVGTIAVLSRAVDIGTSLTLHEGAKGMVVNPIGDPVIDPGVAIDFREAMGWDKDLVLNIRRDSLVPPDQFPAPPPTNSKTSGDYQPYAPGWFAFWGYDLFPYILGGVISHMDGNGDIWAEGYGRGYAFRPIKIMPAEEGQKLRKQLEEMRIDHRTAERDLHEQYLGKLRWLLDGRIPIRQIEKKD